MNPFDKPFAQVMVRANIGMLAISFSFLLALLQVQELDDYLTLALICCSIVFPFSFYFGLLQKAQVEIEMGQFKYYSLGVITFLQLIVVMVGLSSIVNHFSKEVGSIYKIVAYVAVGVFLLVEFIDTFPKIKELIRLKKELKRINPLRYSQIPLAEKVDENSAIPMQQAEKKAKKSQVK
jgi:hypothetical protein